MVETQHSAEALEAIDCTEVPVEAVIGLNQLIAESLVIPLLMVVRSKLASSFPKRPFSKEDHPYTLTTIHSRAENLLRLGRFADAEKAATDSYVRHQARYGSDREETIAAVELLIELYEKWGREAQAAEYRAKLP